MGKEIHMEQFGQGLLRIAKLNLKENEQRMYDKYGSQFEECLMEASRKGDLIYEFEYTIKDDYILQDGTTIFGDSTTKDDIDALLTAVYKKHNLISSTNGYEVDDDNGDRYCVSIDFRECGK